MQLPADDLPLALRRWYAYSAAWRRPLTQQNRILPAEDLERLGGRTVFYVENQSVWHWSFGDGPNPEVSNRANPSDDSWVPTGELLCEFLAHVAVFEAVMSDRHVLVANDISRDERDSVLLKLTPCDFVPWRWPGPQSALWQGDRVVAMAGVNQRPDTPVTPSSRWFVFVGGRTAEALDHLNPPGVAWDYDSRSH